MCDRWTILQPSILFIGLDRQLCNQNIGSLIYFLWQFWNRQFCNHLNIPYCKDDNFATKVILHIKDFFKKWQFCNHKAYQEYSNHQLMCDSNRWTILQPSIWVIGLDRQFCIQNIESLIYFLWQFCNRQFCNHLNIPYCKDDNFATKVILHFKDVFQLHQYKFKMTILQPSIYWLYH